MTKPMTSWLERNTPLSTEQLNLLENRFNFRFLGILIASAVLAEGSAIGLHYVLLLLRVIHRGRRICDVPAVFSCMLVEVPGRIVVLGRHGCRFVPDDETDVLQLQGVSAGTYCTIEVSDLRVAAKLRYDVDDLIKMLFVDPLTPTQLTQLLAGSRTPARYDYSAVRGSSGRRTAFGRGALPPA